MRADLIAYVGRFDSSVAAAKPISATSMMPARLAAE
jgi:hypothetical protein